MVQIVDDGPGIPLETQSQIFDPSFTTKEIGEGTGLGLDIVRRVVAGHGGVVSVDSKPGQTCFTVRLPKQLPQHKVSTRLSRVERRMATG